MNSAGEFVIAWTSDSQDGSTGGVYAQRYDANGVAVDGEFLVNTTTAGHQDYASVSLNAAGEFVITWSSYDQDGSFWGVYARSGWLARRTSRRWPWRRP